MPVPIVYENAEEFGGGLNAEAAAIVEFMPHWRTVAAILRRRNLDHPDWAHTLTSSPLYVAPRRGALRCFAIISRLDRVLPGGGRQCAERIRVSIHAFPTDLVVSDVHVSYSNEELMASYRLEAERLGLESGEMGQPGGPLSVVLLVQIFFPEVVRRIMGVDFWDERPSEYGSDASTPENSEEDDGLVSPGIDGETGGRE